MEPYEGVVISGQYGALPILKWIHRSVGPSQREAFHRAQQAWSDTATESGFLFQVGGWDKKHADQVGILAAWESLEHHERFMSKLHDRITSRSRQEETYHPVLTRVFTVLFPMPGTVADRVDAFVSAEVVRVAHCTVRPGREDHFQTVQNELWAPGMSRAGIRGGFFARDRRRRSDYLVCSAWSTVADHTDYMRIHFPGLQSRADVEADVDNLVGSLLRLEPMWTVRRAP